MAQPGDVTLENTPHNKHTSDKRPFATPDEGLGMTKKVSLVFTLTLEDTPAQNNTWGHREIAPPGDLDG